MGLPLKILEREHVIKLVQQEGLFVEVTKATRVSDLKGREWNKLFNYQVNHRSGCLGTAPMKLLSYDVYEK